MGKLIKIKILSKADFEKCPIWVWDDTREYKIPITDTEPSWEDFDTFFIKTKFKTNGYQLDGYLVGNNNYFAFTLFVGSENVKFNVNSDSLNEGSLKKLFQALHCKPFNFFPVEYESDVIIKGANKISGVINMLNKTFPYKK
jgi:hypothetical protein